MRAQIRLGRPNPLGGCPLTAALAAIGGKWNLIIVYWLADSPKHFAALRRVMPGISQKVLTQQLRELMSDGIVHRQPKGDRKSTRLNSSHGYISYAVFCLKKKKKKSDMRITTRAMSY